MFTPASSISRRFSLAIVVALLGSLQVSIASATTTELEDGYYDCATGVKRADSNTIDPYNAVFVWIIDGKAYNNSCSGNVVLPDGTSGVGSGAFEDSQVTSITIPSSVTRFEDYALVGSASLGDVYFLGNAPDYVGIQAFHNLAAGAKAHITSTATGFGTEPTWNGLNIEVAEPQTVTFNSKGGSSVSTDSINAGEALGEPAAPSRSGYTFQGWSATDGGSAVSFPYSPGVTEDITLYALWSADSHTVTFNSNGGSSIASGSFISGGSIDFPSSSSRYFGDSLPEGVMALPGEGVFHLGNEVSTSVSGWVTKVYYYRYAEDSLHQSASVWSSDGVLLGSKAFVGGTASGWQSVTLDDPVYIAAGETFIVSVLTPTTPFTVALTEMQSNSGPLSFIAVKASAPTENFVALESNTEALSLVDLQFDVASVPTPTREGFAFQGWSDTNGGSVISFPYTPAVLDDITLYAKWSTATYDVTFNSKGGSSVASGSFEHNGSLAIPYDPTRAGYSFLGWSATDGGSPVSFPYSPGVTEDITLYALWSANSYVVSFDEKGGSTVSDASFVTGGQLSYDYTRDEISRPGYTFLGWSETDGGSAISWPYYPGVASNITLYAVWSPDTHNIFFLSDGSFVHYLTYVTDGSIVEPSQPTRTGHTFMGWSATEGGSAVSFPYSPGGTGFKVMYALWSINTYVVTFNPKGGTAVSAGSFVTDGSVTEPTAPTRLGYTFAGWSATDGGSAITFPYGPGVASNVTLYAKWISLPPVMGLTSASTLLPGDIVSLNVSRVSKGCTVTIGWTDSGLGIAPVSKVVKSDRTTGVFSIATPTTAGTYTLSTSELSAGCAGGSAVTLTRSVVVGKSLSITAKVSSSSGYDAKSPVFSVSGTVKSGSVAVSGKQVSVSLRRNGVEVQTATGITSSSGALNVVFTGTTYVAGSYTAVVTGVADSTYLAVQVTTAKLRLRSSSDFTAL